MDSNSNDRDRELLEKSLEHHYVNVDKSFKAKYGVDNNVSIGYNEALDAYLYYQVMFCGPLEDYNFFNIKLLSTIIKAVKAKENENDYELLAVLIRLREFILCGGQSFLDVE